MWDFIGDGSSKLYGSVGRFYYAIPTDLNARVFTANTLVDVFNYSATDLQNVGTNAPRGRLIQVGSFAGEPVDPSLKAPYQDEYTLGVEKALDPTLSVGLKGTYRSLGRTVEDRCDLDYNDPQPTGSSCAIFNPGSTASVQNGGITSCDSSVNPADPNAGQCGLPSVAVGPAKRIFRGIELTARKQFSQTLWAQASYLVLDPARQLLGRDPRRRRPDGPRHQRGLRLQPVPDERLRQPRARPAAPVPVGRGLDGAVRPRGRLPGLRAQRNPDVA